MPDSGWPTATRLGIAASVEASTLARLMIRRLLEGPDGRHHLFTEQVDPVGPTFQRADERDNNAIRPGRRVFLQPFDTA